jgi:hypothetical protein
MVGNLTEIIDTLEEDILFSAAVALFGAKKHRCRLAAGQPAWVSV